MVFLVTDVYDNHSYDFIARLTSCQLTMVYPSHRVRSKRAQWFSGAFRALRCSRKDDCLVFVYDFQAIIAWWVCLLTGMRRRFVCINLLLEPRGGLRGWIVNALYRKPLGSSYFKATVTSFDYGRWLNEKLGISAEYDVLHEVFHESYRSGKPTLGTDVFCGGRNGRDWDFMLGLAASMPDLSFTLVMPSQIVTGNIDGKPSNVHVLSSIPEMEFLSLLSGASIVCLPLMKQSPAGLIVLLQAAANDRPVIISDTVTSREYCSQGRGLALPNDLKVWREGIRHLMRDNEAAAQMALSLSDYCRTECSEEKYVLAFDSILKSFLSCGS